MATIDVKDAAGSTVALEKPLAPGQAARAASRPVTISLEDLAALIAAFKAEDAAHASGDTGMFALAVRRDTAASGASTDGDYATLNVDGSGRLWVNVGTMAALPAGTNNIGDVDIVGGTIAHDAADSGNPIKIGAVARTSAPGAVAAGDRVDLSADVYGSLRALIVGADGAAIDQTATINVAQDVNAMKNGNTSLTPKFAKIAASSSGNNTLVAAVTGKKIRVLAYNFMGNGAVNAKFQDGASGTDLTGLKYIAAAGGGICAPFNPVGWFETTAATLLNLNLSGAVAVGGEITYVEV